MSHSDHEVDNGEDFAGMSDYDQTCPTDYTDEDDEMDTEDEWDDYDDDSYDDQD